MVRDARTRTLTLVDDLDDHQLFMPKSPIVNPYLWELGHLTYFYEAFLLRLLEDREPLIKDGNDLYNSFEVDHDDRWNLPLPTRTGTLEYMQRVYDLALARLEKGDPGPQETYLYLLAVLHEDMHGEASMYMRQTLAYPEPQLLTSSEPVLSGPWPGDAEIAGGTFQLGSTPDQPFVFDNEKWAHPVEVPPFKIAKAPVTNTEYAAFVEDGGYLEYQLWSYQGKKWLAKSGLQHPIYWCRGGLGWLRRHYDTMVHLEVNAPVVHLTYYEAEAYCRWAGRRLPTEAEWELAATAVPGSESWTKRRYPWGDENPGPEHANLDARYGGCVDVAAFPKGDSAYGCRQMMGNVWEWTATPFYPFPGYLVDYPYVEYSAPWFGYPKVLKGGAWATRSRLARPTYRNFFPHVRNDTFAGFRTCAI